MKYLILCAVLLAGCQSNDLRPYCAAVMAQVSEPAPSVEPTETEATGDPVSSFRNRRGSRRGSG